MNPRQIALPLSPGARAGGGGDADAGRIVVGNANQAAIAACDAAAGWPFGTAVLFGPARSGKSRIARWFSASGRGEAVDDADMVDEVALFHRWNAAREAGRALLLTARSRQSAADAGGVDAAWVVALPDLASRIGAALRLEIGAPDDAMLRELIIVHAEARGLPIAPAAAGYLASRCERSHVGAEHLVAAIDRLSLEEKASPGPAIWRRALAETGAGADRDTPGDDRQGQLW